MTHPELDGHRPKGELLPPWPFCGRAACVLQPDRIHWQIAL